METIKLDYPVKANGATVSELNIRRPTVADLRRMNMKVKDEMGQSIALLSDLAEITPDTVEAMDVADFKRVNEVVSGFLS